MNYVYKISPQEAVIQLKQMKKDFNIEDGIKIIIKDIMTKKSPTIPNKNLLLPKGEILLEGKKIFSNLEELANNDKTIISSVKFCFNSFAGGADTFYRYFAEDEDKLFTTIRYLFEVRYENSDFVVYVGSSPRDDISIDDIIEEIKDDGYFDDDKYDKERNFLEYYEEKIYDEETLQRIKKAANICKEKIKIASNLIKMTEEWLYNFSSFINKNKK